MKRLLNFEGSDFLNLRASELKQAILASEGRTIVSESVVVSEPYLMTVTNAEVEKAFGADILLLNVLDLNDPKIKGVPSYVDENHVIWLKKALSRPIGVNLEPVDEKASMTMKKEEISDGRKANIDNYKKADELGIDFICLTGNPATGVTNDMIASSIKEAKKNYKGLVIAGKMHSSGTGGVVMDLAIAQRFIDAGCDILLIPAPYTIPHFTENNFLEIANYVRDYNEDKDIDKKVLIMSAIGTSQETSDEATIRQIALSAKANGAHMQHIGDAMSGISLPQNIYALGVAIRGIRRQMTQMSASIIRGEDKKPE